MEEKDLFSELHLETFSEEERQRFIADVGELLQKRVLLRIAQDMKEEDKEEFEKFLEDENTTPEQVNDYLREKFPNIDEIIGEEIEAIKKDFLSVME